MSHEASHFSFDPSSIASRRKRLYDSRSHPSRCRNLGWFCEQYKDYAGARKWYVKATRKNSSSGTAFMELAKLYESGLGVPLSANDAKNLRERGKQILE